MTVLAARARPSPRGVTRQRRCPRPLGPRCAPSSPPRLPGHSCSCRRRRSRRARRASPRRESRRATAFGRATLRRAPCRPRSPRSCAAPACRRRASPSRCARSTAATRRRCSPFMPSSRSCSPRRPSSSPRSPRSTCSARSIAGAPPPTPPAPVSERPARRRPGHLGGPVGLTGNELRRWFVQMRDEGLQTIFGNIVLDDVALLHERDPKQVKATAERTRARRADRRAHLQPGQAAWSRCARPRTSARR